MGKMYRTGFFELSRGFPHQCTYCVNHNYQKLFKGLGKYNRVRPLSQAMDEILHMKEHYGLELLFFIDENFLTMTKARLAAFCSEYRSRVGLPFYIMTRADSLLDEDKPRMLRECGCVTIGIGVESGNEDIRNKLMDKKIPNSVYEKAFANCHRHDIRTTANIMMGLPFETEENILESARFCRKLQARSVSLAIFAPYQGTKLREICVANGFMEDKFYEDINMINHSILRMPQISPERIVELYLKFNDLVYGQ